MRAVLTLLALLVLAAPASAEVTTETASLGSIRAELSYTKKKDKYGITTTTGLTLRVFDGDTQIAGRVIDDDAFYTPIGVNSGDQSVSVRDLDGDGIGEAVFDLYSGGAHCCEITYLYDGATEIVENWGDPGYTFKDYDGDGREELASADAGFGYRIATVSAALYPPLQVFRLQDGALVDVTREASIAPAVRRDARQARKAYRGAVSDTRKDPVYRLLVKTTLAAYAADQCTLGHCGRGYRLVRRTVHRHVVKRAYLYRLRTLLAQFGYDRG